MTYKPVAAVLSLVKPFRGFQLGDLAALAENHFSDLLPDLREMITLIIHYFGECAGMIVLASKPLIMSLWGGGCAHFWERRNKNGFDHGVVFKNFISWFSGFRGRGFQCKPPSSSENFGLLEKGSLQKSQFSRDSREFGESRGSREPQDSGNQRRI